MIFTYLFRASCTRCTSVAAGLTAAQKQAIADCACAAGKSTGTILRAWSKVGTKEYKTAQLIGTLVNQAQVSQTTCTCPKGWASNSTNVDGGVTSDGKCKKLVCQPIGVTPLPANGTAIGTWGFTWGNAILAWGSSANGGKANCVTTVVTPKICKLQ